MTEGDWAAEAYRQERRRKGKCFRRATVVVVGVVLMWLLAGCDDTLTGHHTTSAGGDPVSALLEPVWGWWSIDTMINQSIAMVNVVIGVLIGRATADWKARRHG